jgi:hypothetical protein
MHNGRRPIGIDSDKSCGRLFESPSTEFVTGAVLRETAMSDASESKIGVEIRSPRQTSRRASFQLDPCEEELSEKQTAWEHGATRRKDRKTRQWRNRARSS